MRPLTLQRLPFGLCFRVAVAVAWLVVTWNVTCSAQEIALEYWDYEDDDHYEALDFSIQNTYSGEFEVFSGQYYVLRDRQFVGGPSNEDQVVAYVGSALFLTGVPPASTETPVFQDLENFILTTENDVLNFASNLEYGEMEVNAGSGHDIVWTNIGNDSIYTGQGNDIINSGPGDDVIYAGPGSDVIRAGLGVDGIYGEQGDDDFYFSADNTWSAFSASQGISFVSQNVGSPEAPVNGQRVSASGFNQSHDRFDGGSGVDALFLTQGDDLLALHDIQSPFAIADPNYARIVSIEFIDAQGGNDIVNLTSPTLSYGNVIILGGEGEDVLWSSSGDDVLYGEAGNDVLDGGFGDDKLYGGADNDTLSGRLGNDQLFGEEGDDTFYVGEGLDIVTGGAGTDTIIHEAMDSLPEAIVGFETGTAGDVLDVSRLVSYDPENDTASDFLQLAASSIISGGTDLLISPDGVEPFVELLAFDTAINASIADLVASGNLILVAEPIALPGDYDLDGDVDTDDFQVWREAYGETGGPADGNGDSVVDAADYTVWRDSYAFAQATPIHGGPLTSATLSVVPEPSAALLLLVAVAAAAQRRQRHK